MPTTTYLCRAKAAYKKSSGVLELTPTHLQWTAAGKQAPDLRISNAKAASLFCSKEGSAQVKLKLGLVGDHAGHTFMFTSPQASAEREAFKKELQNIIGMNRASAAPSEPATPGLSTPLQQSLPGRMAMTPRSAPSVSRATSVSSTGRGSSGGPSGPTEDFRLRKKVLLKNQELASLHRELVMSGQITESEFWEGREALLLAEASQESQKRGRPGQLVDPRPESVAGGDIKIVVTPQLVHDIFEEFPVVAKAYNETVPRQLSEAEFWKRYFQSRLFHRHRASVRSSATQFVIKDDSIFDKYVEEEDDGLEPRRQRDDEVDLLVNLLATQEDHTETGNLKDSTMQAGKQKATLPLIRKFNEHSERLLNSAEGSLAKRRRLEEHKELLYSQIDLEDLHDSQSLDGIILEMKDRDRYFDGRTGGASAGADGDTRPDLRSILPETRGQLDDWTSSLSNLRIDKKAGDAALQTMTQNVQQRLEVKMQKRDIPEELFAQMRTCQTAANEFLRQFWSSVVPASGEGPMSSASPARKAAKAARMAGYLVKTPEKIQAIIEMARSSGVDAGKIEMAMKPVSTAVEKALQFYQTRKKP
ncbi:TFB1 [Sanghuangporus vaninii]